MFMKSTNARRCLMMLSVLAIAQSATPPSVSEQSVTDRLTNSSYVKSKAGSDAITVRTRAPADDELFKDFPEKSSQAAALANPDYVAVYTPHGAPEEVRQQRIPARAIRATSSAAVSDTNFALQFSSTNIEQPPLDPAQKSADETAILADASAQDGGLKKIIQDNAITQIVYMSALDALKSSDDSLLPARSYIVTTAANVVQACVFNTKAGVFTLDVLKADCKDLLKSKKPGKAQTTYKIPFFLMIVVAVVLAVIVGVMCCRGSSDSTQNSNV